LTGHPQYETLSTEENNMKTLIKVEMILGIVLVLAFNLPLSGSLYANMDDILHMQVARQTPRPPALAWQFSIFRTAPLEVAKVFGRTPGCADADPDLIQATAKAAIEAGLDPRIFAATIGIESSCNSYATSTRGAIGLSQVVPRIWFSKYDFAGRYNLLNVDDNLHVGAQIEAGLIAEYGVEGGLRHYNGMGTLSADYDTGYTSKILLLAGRRQ
jgi:hypothetical protein